jgi:hypothetical protein
MWTVAFSVSSFRRKLKLSSDVQMPDSITWKAPLGREHSRESILPRELTTCCAREVLFGVRASRSEDLMHR